MNHIEAMKQALEALELHAEQYPHMQKGYTVDAITSLRQAIAEAEKQEPVAWRNAAIRIGEDLCSVGPFGYYDMTAEQWLDWALSVVTVHAPPQPKREPLTDEQIEDAWEKITGHSIFGGNRTEGRPMYLSPDEVIEFARSIEAAHGIKGEA